MKLVAYIESSFAGPSMIKIALVWLIEREGGRGGRCNISSVLVCWVLGVLYVVLYFGTLS